MATRSNPRHDLVMKVFINMIITLFILFSCLLPHYNVAQSINLASETTAMLDPQQNNADNSTPLLVRKCDDFSLTGTGNNSAWEKTQWTLLTKLDKGNGEYESKFKILSSATGIYILFQGEDDKITTADYKDFENIFNGDVFEVFFHTNPAVSVYFEYEINQLDKELILMISNLNGKAHTSWAPRQREGKNQSGIKKMVDIVGGEKKLNATIRSWTAEIFFPYGALGLLPNVPPNSGDLWNANFCRLDYDSGNMIKWSWTPTIKNSFHELDKFRSIKFE